MHARDHTRIGIILLVRVNLLFSKLFGSGLLVCRPCSWCKQVLEVLTNLTLLLNSHPSLPPPFSPQVISTRSHGEGNRPAVHRKSERSSASKHQTAMQQPMAEVDKGSSRSKHRHGSSSNKPDLSAHKTSSRTSGVHF